MAISGKSVYLDLKLLNHTLRGVVYTPPSGSWVALFTVLPDALNAGGIEVSGGSYARQPVTFGAAYAGGPGGMLSNNAMIQFPVATLLWGTIVGYVLYDAVTAGNPLYGNVLTNRIIDVGDRAEFGAGTLIVTEQ